MGRVGGVRTIWAALGVHYLLSGHVVITSMTNARLGPHRGCTTSFQDSP